MKRLGVVIVVLLLAACDSGPKGARGFRLPDGSPEAGKRTFVELGCYVCHRVAGIEATFTGTAAANVPLGGPTSRVRSYGELVTSIINPSHRIAIGQPPEKVAPGGRSLMEFAALNEKMTVQQLIDLVAFLQSTYQVVPPSTDPYSYVYP
ncbi:MAG: cytochrome c [Steroidobacteraceae bacterium]|nr:cytochrome c [Steroidobacteraceae bacterium]MDW8259720.1 cytochrome c [Gammaproteobacteria bacterium]